MLDLVISATCSAAVHAAGKYISQTRKYCPHHKHAWLQLERARWITTRYVFTVEKMFWAIENMDQSQNKIPVALTRKIYGRLYIYSVVGSANSSTKYNCQYTSRLYRRGAKRLMRKRSRHRRQKGNTNYTPEVLPCNIRHHSLACLPCSSSTPANSHLITKVWVIPQEKEKFYMLA